MNKQVSTAHLNGDSPLEASAQAGKRPTARSGRFKPEFDNAIGDGVWVKYTPQRDTIRLSDSDGQFHISRHNFEQLRAAFAQEIGWL